MLHISNSAEENCVNEKQITHDVWKVFDRHVFGPSQNLLIFGLLRDANDQYTNPLARPLMIASASCENIIWISFKRIYGK